MDKRYEEALERAKMILCNLPEGSSSAMDIETIFPELMGDEEMLEFMRNHFYNLVKRQDENERMYTRCLVYLDKLKEQKAIQDSVAVVITSRPTISKFEAGKAAVLNNPEEYGLRKLSEWSEEDEKNWKAVLGYVKDDALRVWLEKQKEQQPADWTDADQEILERIIKRLRFVIPVPAEDPVRVTFEHREDAEAINWLKRRVTSQPQLKQEWGEKDEKMLKSIINILGQNTDAHEEGWAIFADEIVWLKSRRPQANNNLRWRRATEGANLPESIIIPDGEEPRFGKCAVKDSYYIPISELKELPKDES